MTLEQVLAELRELAARSQRGEDVSTRRKELETELAKLGYQPNGQLTAEQQAAAQRAQQEAATLAAQRQLAGVGAPTFGGGAGGQLGQSEREELDRLRAESFATQMAGTADQLAALVQQRTEQHQATQAGLVGDLFQRALQERGLVPANGNDPMLQAAVVEALKGIHGGSRFIGANGQEDAARHLAAGGSFAPGGGAVAGGGYQLGAGVHVANPSELQVGEDRKLTELMESKSLGRLMSVIAKAHKNPYMLEGFEQRFLKESTQKAMAQGTNTAGGFLIPEEWMPDILGLIRKNAVVRRANPKIVPFNKQMNQTSISTGSTAYYTQENARIPVSEMTFAQAPILTPKYLTALVPVSNYLLGNAAGVDSLVRDDMQQALTVREDLAFLQGTGSGGEPIGFRNLPGIILNPIAPGTNGFVPTLPDFRRIKGRTRLAGSANPRWTWFFHPAILTYLETLTDTLGRFLVESNILQVNADGVSGTFDGLPFYASYQIPTALTIGSANNATYVLLINMNDAIVGESVDLTIDVSAEATYSPDGGTTHISAFQQNQTVFRTIIGHDVTHRRPSLGVIDQEGILV